MVAPAIAEFGPTCKRWPYLLLPPMLMKSKL